MNSLEQAQHMAQQHSSLQIGNPPDLADVQRGVQTEDSFAASLMAARLLGFLEHDAQCVAQAWAAQTQRTGSFDPAAWPEEPADFGLSTEPSASAFPNCPQALGLYAVLPDAAWVARMVALGVPTVQLRFKSDDAAAVQREVQAAVKAVQGSQSLLFINDHWEAAIEAGAYGVHLGPRGHARRAAGTHPRQWFAAGIEQPRLCGNAACRTTRTQLHRLRCGVSHHLETHGNRAARLGAFEQIRAFDAASLIGGDWRHRLGRHAQRFAKWCGFGGRGAGHHRGRGRGRQCQAAAGLYARQVKGA
jgi:hypothetical protein